MLTAGPPRFRRHDIGGDIGGLEVAESIDPNDRMYCIPVMRQAAAVLFMRPDRVMSSVSAVSAFETEKGFCTREDFGLIAVTVGNEDESKTVKP